MKKSLFFILGICLFITISSCKKEEKSTQEDQLLEIKDNPTLQAQRFKEVEEKNPLTLSPGLKMNLYAYDSLVPDPIALSIDDNGLLYFTRTNRQKNSEFDIRGYRSWETESIKLQTIEDKRKFLRDTFAPSRSEKNTFLPDLNNDKSHDWKDLTVQKEEIWRLADTNGDGKADVSTRLFEGMGEEISDCAGGLMIRNKDAFLGCGPGLYRFDRTKDGRLTNMKELVRGFGIHIGFGAHGMSGVTQGPDGKVYWGIGDIGANLTDLSGKKHNYANEGVIVRCNPDGSDFEVFAHGLRNTHEFVFDKYGNLITSDNDGDHPGESERLVHIVEGGDCGWRINWQFGKYNDPKNNKYKVWMDEKLYVPRWDGQAAYIIPPIMNFHNGPTGMQYNPGTALGSQYKDKFFLVEFVGNPSNSPIWAFDLKPKGASFELKSEEKMMTGILPTGIKFGIDGALYIADWVNGWNTKNYGRVWKLDTDGTSNDQAELRKETEILMKKDFAASMIQELSALLAHSDMRIRQKAQFELVAKGEEGFKSLSKVLETSKDQLAIIHAIWGIGQLAYSDAKKAETLVKKINDADPEIAAQAIKILGQVRYTPSAEKIVGLLVHPSDRVKFYAAEALGRIRYRSAIDPLIEFIRINDDKDIYLRHAATLALSRLDAFAEVTALQGDPSKAVRTAAVLVLRHLRHRNVAIFLKDQDEYVAAEAARAIHDDHTIEVALPELAACLEQTRLTNEPLLRRAISAAIRIGDAKRLDMLINFAQRKDLEDKIRVEAISALSVWADPSVHDRVDGRYRGVSKRNSEELLAKLKPIIPTFLKSQNPKTLSSTVDLISYLGINDFNKDLLALPTSDLSLHQSIINSLDKLSFPDEAAIIGKAINDKDAGIRALAISKLNTIAPDDKIYTLVDNVMLKGSIQEKQNLISVVSKMDKSYSTIIFNDLVGRATKGQIDDEVMLELEEGLAVVDTNLLAKVKAINASKDDLSKYQAALYGGNKWSGEGYFLYNSTGQCVRCHVVKPNGQVTVGPVLEGIGKRLDRKQLLEALVKPSARIAPGYGQIYIKIDDGKEVVGTLMEETATLLEIKTGDAEPLKIPKVRIKSRESLPSSMPSMTKKMNMRELRDMVEYLASI